MQNRLSLPLSHSRPRFYKQKGIPRHWLRHSLLVRYLFLLVLGSQRNMHQILVSNIDLCIVEIRISTQAPLVKLFHNLDFSNNREFLGTTFCSVYNSHNGQHDNRNTDNKDQKVNVPRGSHILDKIIIMGSLDKT